MKVKPCPFCGGEAQVKWLSGPGWLVKCRKCSARTIGGILLKDDEHKAIAAWNERTAAPEEPPKETETANDIRRIDDLGRVVIPKPMRRAIGIDEGDELELILYPSAGGVFIKKARGEARPG